MTDKAAIVEAYASYKDAVDEYIELLEARIHQLETERLSQARDCSRKGNKLMTGIVDRMRIRDRKEAEKKEVKRQQERVWEEVKNLVIPDQPRGQLRDDKTSNE